ncbi:hypothetical protein WA158_008532 [Blastocystis sp. Blastoise]
MEDILLWALVSAVIILVLIFFCYMGVFSSLPVDTVEQEPMTIAFVNCQGPYRNIDSAYHKLLDEAKTYIGDSFIPTKSIYIYYDDPRGTQNQKLLRWSVGFIVSKEEDIAILSEQNNMHLVTIPSGLALSCIFPYRNIISLGLGGRKAFDAFYSLSQKKEISINTPPMELRSTSVVGAIQYIQYIDTNAEIEEMTDVEFIKFK